MPIKKIGNLEYRLDRIIENNPGKFAITINTIDDILTEDQASFKTLQKIFPEIPTEEDLMILEIKGSNLITIPNNLPKNLEHLYLEIQKLEQLPEDLYDLNLLELISLDVESLPKNLPKAKTVSLISCIKLSSLDNIVLDGLEDLYIDLSPIKYLPILPETLANLSLVGLHIESLPILPDNLENISLKNLQYLKSLPKEILPNKLNSLRLSNCNLITSLPEVLPNSLTILELSHDSITNPPEFRTSLENLPPGLITLILSGTQVKSLPEHLPVSLEKLDLSHCKELESLPKDLPSGLIELNLHNCIKLKSLPENLPNSLKKIDLRECNSLIPTPELVAQLQEIEEKDPGNSVLYPPNFLKENELYKKARSALNSAIEIYAIQNPNKPKPHQIETLLNRFLSEGKYTRDEQSIRKTITPIINILQKNPENIEWMEKIAETYIGQGCINQPVAGWIKISSYAQIFEAPTIEEKLEIAKYAMSFRFIEYYIKTLKPEQQPRAGVEAEFFNSLIKEVHKKLLNDGKIHQEWNGIPGRIAHEFIIKKLLSPELIEDCCNYIEQNVINISEENIMRYFTESDDAEIFAQTSFPDINFSDIREEIKELYQQHKEELLYAIERKNELFSQTSDDEEKDDRQTELEEIYQEKYSSSTKEELNEEYRKLQQEEESSTSFFIKKRMKEAIQAEKKLETHSLSISANEETTSLSQEPIIVFPHIKEQIEEFFKEDKEELLYAINKKKGLPLETKNDERQKELEGIYREKYLVKTKEDLEEEYKKLENKEKISISFFSKREQQKRAQSERDSYEGFPSLEVVPIENAKRLLHNPLPVQAVR